MGDWHISPVFNSTTLVMLVGAALLASLMLLSSELRRLTSRRRYLLLGMRLTVFFLVVLAMFRPTFIIAEYKQLPATVVVLADRSTSMSVADAGLSAQTRWANLRQRLEEAMPELEKLQENFEIKVYTFDSDLTPIDFSDGKLDVGDIPDGKQTAIGAAIDDILRRESGKRIAAMVLLSDGAHQAFTPRDLPPQDAVRRLADLGAPLYTVTFGQDRSVSQSRDLAVTDLVVSPTVYVKNELQISGNLRASGLTNEDITVQLLFETAPGKMEVVSSKTIKVTSEGEQIPVDMIYVPLSAGEKKITLRAIPPPGTSELVTSNNELSTFVTVLEGGLNVLYLEGLPRPELTHLKRALNASPDIQVTFELRDARDRAKWGEDNSEWFKPGKYNVYIIGDLDSEFFRKQDLEALVKAVDQGAGLIMLGGYHSFWPGGYQDTPLKDILPIEVDDIARKTRQQFDEPAISDPNVHIPGPIRMLPDKRFGDSVSFMQLGPRATNRAEWEKLPPLKGANNFSSLKQNAKPLAVTDANQVLLAAIEPGNGRVLAFAGDTTYQWAMQGFGDMHKRFWRQVILWLAKVDESTAGSVWVKLDQRRYSPGRRVEFSAGIRSKQPEAIAKATYTAEVILPNGQKRPVQLSREGDHAVGSFNDTQEAGDYQIVVTSGTERGSGRFTVQYQDLELDNPAARPAMMASLSKMTPDGEAIAPERLGELFRKLQEKPAELQVERQTKNTPWDKPWYFLLIVGLLSGEWFLRKKWGLV